MKTSSDSQQYGFGHIGLILAVVGVLSLGGLIAWRYLGAQKPAPSSAATSLAQQLATAKCDYDDKDLCKFFVSWKQHDNYRMSSKSVDKKENATTSITYDVQGDKTYSLIKSPAFNSTTITVGARTTYILAANGTWWKQTLPENEQTTATETVPKVELNDPSEETTDTAAPKTEYKLVGKEACGKLTCFKYQVLNPDVSGTTEYIWFDNKDYQLRRSTSESADFSSDMTFTYDGVVVKVPATYNDLAPNQVLMPGASEPTTIPTAADFQ